MNTLTHQVEEIWAQIEAETDQGYTFHSATQLIKRDRQQLARHRIITRDGIEYCARDHAHWPCLDAATVIAYWLQCDTYDITRPRIEETQ